MALSLRTLARVFAVCVVLISAACAAPQAAAQSAPAAVDIVYGEWRDEARDRTVPYKLYLPATREAAPVVIFSHGLGGSREAANYLMTNLAENGFAAIVIQHPGTDESLLQGGGRLQDRLNRGIDGPSAVARFGDVRFVIDQLERETASGRFAGRFDVSRLGMSGHSYGALTTLVAVGQRLGAAAGDTFRDPRIDAAIVYSPNAPRNQNPEAALSGIATPILHFTGTEDRTPFDLEPTPEGRQIPFRTIDGADQYLIVFDGGDHMIFSGRVQASGSMTAAQAAQTEAIELETLTFWRAYLLNDAEALSALCSLPARVDAIANGEVKAQRCGASP
jgi:predicted dienelactone hydrolase